MLQELRSAAGSIALVSGATAVVAVTASTLAAFVLLGVAFGSAVILHAKQRSRVSHLNQEIAELRARRVEVMSDGLPIDPRVGGNDEATRARKLREDEARALEMIAEDQDTKAILEAITTLLSNQYPGSRFRIVTDDLFDQEPVDATWPIVVRTETGVGWVLQAVVQTGATPEAEVVGLAQDLARLAIDKARHRRTLRYQADHDALTGLLSRRAVLEVLDLAIGLGETVGTVYCDIDKFKEINDTLGHQVGDELLIAIAQRLQDAADEAPFACEAGRLGGDEYLLVASGAERDDMVRFVDGLSFAMRAPFAFEAATISTSLSIGASFSADREDSQAELDGAEILRESDLALYQVKRNGRNDFRFFDAELREIQAENKAIEEDLRKSISQRSGLYAQFQPQFDADGDLVGFEALGRWSRQGKGMVPPDEFIPIAVERGLMAKLDLEIFRHTVNVVSNLRSEGQNLGSIAINVSAERLEDPKFVSSTIEVLRRASIDPRTVVLEITESSLLNDVRERGRRLEQLRAWGVRIAIDDFGTGYSSLSYLRDLPVDIVKLDKEFVSQIERSAEAQAIVSAILALAKVMKLEVIAEGIEREPQRKVLADLGCDLFQGFMLGRPLVVDDAQDLAALKWPPNPFETGGYEWSDVPPSPVGYTEIIQPSAKSA